MARLLLLLTLALAERRLGDWDEICQALEQEAREAALTTAAPTVAPSTAAPTVAPTAAPTTSSGPTATQTTQWSSSTRTYTTTTTQSYEERQLIQFRSDLKAELKEDGKALVKDLISWLLTRLVLIFVSIILATPLLILLIHRSSRRCRSCIIRHKERPFSRLSTCLLFGTFLVAVGGSILLALSVLGSVDVTIKEVSNYYLKGFVQNILQDILGEVSKINANTITTDRKQQLNTTVCNPTDDFFVMHSLDARATLEEALFLTATLPKRARIAPRTLGVLSVDYHVLPDLGGILAGAVNVVMGSILAHKLGRDEEVAMISVLLNMDCRVRQSRATVGLQINAPLLLSRLPDSFLLVNPKTQTAVISKSFSDPTKAMYHLFNALLGGLEIYPFFQWDSVNLGGPLMAWVYGILFFASTILTVSVTGIVLLLMTCRRKASPAAVPMAGASPRSDAYGDAAYGAHANAPRVDEGLDSVLGRTLASVEIDIPEEESKPKPHLTKSVSRVSVPRIIQS